MAIAGTLEIQMLANVARLQSDMNQAKSAVTNATAHIERAVSSAKTALASLGITLGIGAFAAMIKGSIDAADHLNDLSKSTALTVEQLAGLSIAAKQSGSDLDGVASSITKLAQNMGKDVEKFRQAGITARDPLEAFKQLADLFVAIEDPQTRAALGAATLGKNWATAAPLLAEGGAAIGEMVDKGTRLSGVTAELAKQSDAFNDKLVLLTGTSSIMNSVTGQLLPLMNKLAGDMLEARERADGLNGSFSPLLESFKAVVVVGGNVSFVLTAIGKDLGATAAQLVAFASGNWSEILTIRAERLADAAKERSAFDAWERSIMAVGTAAQVAASKLDSMDQVSRRMASSAAAAARAESEAAAKRARGLIGGDGSGTKKTIDEYEKIVKAADKFVESLKKEADQLGLTAIQKKMMDAATVALTLKTDAERMAVMKAAKAWADAMQAIEDKIAADKAAAVVTARAIEITQAYIKELEDLTAQGKEWAEYEAAKNKTRDDSILATQALIDQIKFETTLIGKSSAERRIAIALRAMETAGVKLQDEGMRRFLATLSDVIKAQEDAIASDNALKSINAFLDPARAQSFGDALAGAFGNAGNALGKLAQALDTYGRKEAEIEKMRQESLKILDPIKRKEIEIALNEKSADAQVRAYGDMAGAAAGFFETGSDGYNALMAVSKAFHAVELAGQLAEMVPRGINAILNQGNGDPYSAFARMAAMAAIVAGLGVAIGGGVGGGGGGQTAADRQRAQGAGTVLGDADAKSQSLLNAIKEIEKTDKIGLGYTRDMLDALHAIQDSMANLAALIFRTTGLTTGENFNVSTGTQRNQGSVLMGALGIDDSWFMKWQNTVTMGLAGWLVGLVGKTTTEITDAGLLIFGRLSELLSGQNMQQYINVRSSSSIFGINIGSSNSSQTGPLDPAVVAQFSLIFKGIADSVEAAAKALNVWTPYFREAMENIALDIGAISLKDLKGQELQDALNAIFSSASDTIAHTMIPGFEAFQKVGEGYYETLIRVASTNEYVKNTMDALGMTLGLVGMDGITARLELAELAGGLENFGKITQSYFENFYTAAEQRGNAARNLVAEFSRLGVVMPESAAAFRQLVEAQDLTTAAGREMWAALMALNVPFAEFINSVLGLDGKMHALSDVTAQHASLQDRLDLALGTKTAQQIERAREMAEAIDNLSLSMLQSIYAAEDTKAGVEAAQDRRRAEMRVEAQLMEAQGNHAGALALIRALETEGMNAAEIASYDYIQSLLAQIEAINAAARANRELGEGVGKTGGLMVDMRDSVTEALNTEIELRNRLFELTHTESEVLERNRQIRLDELRIMEITGNLVAGTLTSIQEQIYAQEDLNAAMQATTATFQDFFIGSAQWWNQQVQAAQDAADAAAKAAADAAKAAKAWSDHLTEWLNRNALSDMSPLTAQQQLEEARRQYSLALGGTDVGAITRAADALLAADKAVEGFGGGYSALYAAIRDDLAGLADAGPTLTPGESAIVSSVDNLYDEMRDTKETVAKLLERLIESTKDQTSEVAGAVKSGATKQAAATDKAAAIGERR